MGETKWRTKSGKNQHYWRKCPFLHNKKYAAEYSNNKQKEETEKGKQHSKQPKSIANKTRKYRV